MARRVCTGAPQHLRARAKTRAVGGQAHAKRTTDGGPTAGTGYMTTYALKTLWTAVVRRVVVLGCRAEPPFFLGLCGVV